MTRKDYEMVAKAIMEWHVSENAECLPLLNRLTAAFEKDNPRFDRERFVRACTVAWDVANNRKTSSK